MEPELQEAAFTVEQGLEMNRDGRVKVEVRRSCLGQMDVLISGTAVKVNEFRVSL
jgi:predicted PhzF superfamily epimerase YddE/YHI9